MSTDFPDPDHGPIKTMESKIHSLTLQNDSQQDIVLNVQFSDEILLVTHTVVDGKSLLVAH